MLSTHLSTFKQALIQARTLQSLKVALAALTPALGITYDEHHAFGRHPYQYVTITYVEPVSAVLCCEVMGWERPYALSTDVHQTRWQIRLWEADLADPFGPRIHTRVPALGVWAILPQLSGRPQGELPSLRAGASPAYDLRIYAAAIVAFEVHAQADLE
jgi:hypothetical protein